MTLIERFYPQRGASMEADPNGSHVKFSDHIVALREGRLTGDDRSRLNEIAGELEHLPAEFRRNFDQDGLDVRFLRILAGGEPDPPCQHDWQQIRSILSPARMRCSRCGRIELAARWKCPCGHSLSRHTEDGCLGCECSGERPAVVEQDPIDTATGQGRR